MSAPAATSLSAASLFSTITHSCSGVRWNLRTQLHSWIRSISFYRYQDGSRDEKFPKSRSPVCGVQGCSSLHQLLNNAWRVRGSPGASHVKSCVAIVVGNVYISSMLDQHSNSGKVGICCCSMQCSSTKCGSCVGGFTTLQSGDEFILKVKT